MFESVNVLRELCKPNDMLKVYHGGHEWIAKFEWKRPFTERPTNDREIYSVPLPEDYRQFLTFISDGCLLYYDTMYGQWGYKIYSLLDLPMKQDVWKELFGHNWRDSFIIFGELIGEGNALIFDTAQPTKDAIGCQVMESNPIDPIQEWPTISRSFHIWLDHLITAQGDKYWMWR